MRLKQAAAVLICAGIIGASMITYSSVPVEAVAMDTEDSGWEPIPEKISRENPHEDHADDDMLVRIAMSEAGTEDTEGKALVMRVVLNRVSSEEFPDTVSEVIRQHDGNCYQFTVIGNGRYDSAEPDEDCWKALKMVRNGWDESQGATYFEGTTSRSTWHKRNLTELFTHGGHTFYKEKS